MANDKLDESGPPLWRAIHDRDTATALTLIARGTSLEARPDRGARQKKAESPLALALWTYQPELAAALIAAGAAVDGPADYRKNTPLQLAVARNYADVVAALLHRGADPTAEGRWNIFHSVRTSSVMRAVLTHVSKEQARDLLQEPTSSERRSVLHSMIRDSAQLEALDLAIAAGGDINAVDNEGRTPLHTAAGAGNSQVAALLLEHGATVTPDSEGLTPIDMAYVQGHAALGERLARLVPARGRSPRPPRHDGGLAIDLHVKEVCQYLEQCIRNSEIPFEIVSFCSIAINPYWTISEVALTDDREIWHRLVIDPKAEFYPAGFTHLQSTVDGILDRFKLSVGKDDDPSPPASYPGHLVAYPLVLKSDKLFATLRASYARFSNCHFGWRDWSRVPFNWARADMLRNRIENKLRRVFEHEQAFDSLAQQCFEHPDQRRWFQKEFAKKSTTSYRLDSFVRTVAASIAKGVEKDCNNRTLAVIRLAKFHEELLISQIDVETDDGDTISDTVTIKDPPLPSHIDFLDTEDELLLNFCEERRLDMKTLSWTSGLAHEFLHAALCELAWQVENRLRDRRVAMTRGFRVFYVNSEDDYFAQSFVEQREALGQSLQEKLPPCHRPDFLKLMYEGADRIASLL